MTSRSDVLGRWRQMRRIVRADGLTALSDRFRRRLAHRVAPAATALDVRRSDVLARPAHGRTLPRTADGDPMTLNWVITPPAPGSGGHTTILRIVALLESFGHDCRLYLNNRHHGDLHEHEGVIRRHWPQVRAPVRDLATGLPPAHAIIATSWDTVYAVASQDAAGTRCYFVQDFEPFFYPVGSQHILAENTYRMGFHGITIGPWLADKLSSEYGMTCDWFAFGCDLDRYQLRNVRHRDGVVFYARPSTPRRAFELGIMALEVFAEEHPDVPIHLFGERSGDLPFATTDHGLLAPAELDALYNRCAAGLVLSLTNISLVPWELLASGCTPVINDAPHNRAVLDLPTVRYSAPTPHALAEALGAAVAQPQPMTARAAAASIEGTSWFDAGRTVERILRAAVPTTSPDPVVVQGEGEHQRAGGRGSAGEGERQRAGGRGSR